MDWCLNAIEWCNWCILNDETHPQGWARAPAPTPGSAPVDFVYFVGYDSGQCPLRVNYSLNPALLQCAVAEPDGAGPDRDPKHPFAVNPVVSARYTIHSTEPAGR